MDPDDAIEYCDYLLEDLACLSEKVASDFRSSIQSTRRWVVDKRCITVDMEERLFNMRTEIDRLLED